MMDLQAAMARAAPRPMSIGKDEWLAKRSAEPRSVRRNSRQHGSSADSSLSSSSSSSSSSSPSSPSLVTSSLILADIPLQVPELPSAYLVRESDLAEIKAALFSEGTAGSTALTSEMSKRSKVGAHGMVSNTAGCICSYETFQCAFSSMHTFNFTGRRGEDNYCRSSRAK